MASGMRASVLQQYYTCPLNSTDRTLNVSQNSLYFSFLQSTCG